jgi:hypothetical protein
MKRRKKKGKVGGRWVERKNEKKKYEHNGTGIALYYKSITCEYFSICEKKKKGVCVCVWGERERERETHTETERETDRDREREKERERER